MNRYAVEDMLEGIPCSSATPFDVIYIFCHCGHTYQFQW